MELVRVVAYVVLAGVAPTVVLCVGMLRGLRRRRTAPAEVVELRLVRPREPERASSR